MMVSWWMSRRLVLKWPHVQVRHVMGFEYIFEYWFVVDVLVELRVWCDLCERLSIGFGILKDSFMSSMGEVGNSHWNNDYEGVVLCEMLGLTWSYSSCGSCFGVWVVVSDWMIG
jgi:hypothetical protein